MNYLGVAGSTSKPMCLLPTQVGAPRCLAALRDIYNAEDIDKAQVAIKAFELDYGAKYPNAVAKITGDAVRRNLDLGPATHIITALMTSIVIVNPVGKGTGAVFDPDAIVNGKRAVDVVWKEDL